MSLSERMHRLKWKHLFVFVFLASLIVVIGASTAGNDFVLSVANWVVAFSAPMLVLAHVFDV